MSDFVQNLPAGTAADWVGVLVAVINIVIGVAIAINLHALSRITEKNQSSQAIYDQWMRKKELSIHVPAISELDSKMYSPRMAYDTAGHQRRVYMVLIIDILFNSFLAARNGLYPKEIYDEDMTAHFGAMLRYDADLVETLMVERGYAGAGVVGEFYLEVQRLKARLQKAQPE
jgi:hypothetical protein